VRYWLIDFARDDPTSSEIRTRIFAALQRAGMIVSIPAQRVFMTLEGRSRKERKRNEELERRVVALSRVHLLEPLNDAERHELAAALGVAPFCKGEIITRQGTVAHHLYIITRGEAEVCVAVGSAPAKRVAGLHAGDVFGEIGLLLGDPRHATVTALTDVLCYRLDKAAFEDILHSRPEIADGISHLLAERKTELDAVAEGLNEEAKRQRMTHASSDMLHRIRQFFTLS
jgi:CRP-like cAMP-binding protein